jgi:hypothetical protein
MFATFLTHGYVFLMGVTSVILYESWGKDMPMWKIIVQTLLWPWPWGVLIYELIKGARASKRSV